jgi:glycosyltransferase involved in cell wall biosynthesis
MDIPIVSIGLPVYNGQEYLTNAIDSILSQEFEDFELIISDNASEDGTEDICRLYARGQQNPLSSTPTQHRCGS